MHTTHDRPRPRVDIHLCKGCGRCIDSCPKHCIAGGTEICQATGLIPIQLHLDACNGCALCLEACPEPYGLVADAPPVLRAAPPPLPAHAIEIPDERVALPRAGTAVLKGTYASAVGALLAGCRHFFGYPITPSTDGAERMAKLLPQLDGFFVQAVSEVATINHIYGAGGAGLRAMTFTSSPGFSLMLEGISYLIGAEVPGVIVDVMRGGPGLGNIAPEQGDIKLACRGLGHGNTFAPVLAPSTPQEMLDLTMLAFELSFRYRHPVIVLADGYLGQMTGRVTLPGEMIRPGRPAWAVWGDRAHRKNLITSIDLEERELERHNAHLDDKYARMRHVEQRVDEHLADDADVLIVAANTPARIARGAVRELRAAGVRAGLFRPVTLWPFPIDALTPLLHHVRAIVVVEASSGQLEDELRLALSHAEVAHPPPITHVRHAGGVLPEHAEIVTAVRAALDPGKHESPHRRFVS